MSSVAIYVLRTLSEICEFFVDSDAMSVNGSDIVCYITHLFNAICG